MSKIEYILVGEYLLPNLILAEPVGEEKALGLYAQLHKRYLQDHRPVLYCELLLSGKLFAHLQGIDQAVSSRTAAGASYETILSELIYV